MSRAVAVMKGLASEPMAAVSRLVRAPMATVASSPAFRWKGRKAGRRRGEAELEQSTSGFNHTI